VQIAVALIIPDEIHDPLRWSDWVRAYRATGEFSAADWLLQAKGDKPAAGRKKSKRAGRRPG
jgi:hypothetical protein